MSSSQRIYPPHILPIVLTRLPLSSAPRIQPSSSTFTPSFPLNPYHSRLPGRSLAASSFAPTRWSSATRPSVSTLWKSPCDCPTEAVLQPRSFTTTCAWSRLSSPHAFSVACSTCRSRLPSVRHSGSFSQDGSARPKPTSRRRTSSLPSSDSCPRSRSSVLRARDASPARRA